MNALFDAILIKYNAHGDLSGALSEMALIRASERRTYPYCVFFPVTERPLDTFTEDIENFLLQFNIYDDADRESPTNIDTIRGYLWDCFDDCSLTVSGYHHIFMQRRNTFPLDTGDSYQYSIEYEIMLERQPYIYPVLDGDSQYFYRTDADFPESGITGDLTIQGWINIDPSWTGTSRFIAGKWGDHLVSKRSYSFRIFADELLFELSDDGQDNPNIRSTNGELYSEEGNWIHVAATFDASEGECALYKNGIALATDILGTIPNSIADKTADFQVGKVEAFEIYFPGGIDNVALFDDIRTATEIAASAADRYEDLSAEGNLIGYWMFDDVPAATKIDNAQGDAGRDLIPYDGGDVTYGECGRTVDKWWEND